MLEDSSVNGTLVNDVSFKSEKTMLKHGDIITVGDRSFRYEFSGHVNALYDSMSAIQWNLILE
jgi:predicted component of type VI protein secretion system